MREGIELGFVGSCKWMGCPVCGTAQWVWHNRPRQCKGNDCVDGLEIWTETRDGEIVTGVGTYGGAYEMEVTS